MIVRMSKVEIFGPKDLLDSVLSLLRESAIFQIEPTVAGFIENADKRHVRAFAVDEKTVAERMYLENLRLKIRELLSYLPEISIRKSSIDPRAILDTVEKNLQAHIQTSRDMFHKKEASEKELLELKHHALFFRALEDLFENITETPDLDFIGITIKDTRAIDGIRQLLSGATKGEFELYTVSPEGGGIIGVITIKKNYSEAIRCSLSNKNVPELSLPDGFGGLAFQQKLAYFNDRLRNLLSEVEGIKAGMELFSRRWLPIYHAVNEWISDRLSLICAAASVFETRMCFLVDGWMPSIAVNDLRGKFKGAFAGKVMLEEKEMVEEDIDRVPILLKNPPYFKPFELFAGLLPLPRYASFDPTPFIGIFFPLFFGMILGDAGYGAVIMIVSLYLIKRFGARRYLGDASRIMFGCSIYAVFFGLLYGEFFGDLGKVFFGLKPLCIERRSAVIPMLFFAVSVGVVHVMIGIMLGFIAMLKKKAKKEALHRFLNAAALLCTATLVAVLFDVFPDLLATPVILAILILTPLIFFTGGILAPLELLRNIGNVISYARIMAIGLASVLLAFVANRLAGMTGNIITGILVAGLLHSLNILLGIFSPAIHSLRLHYVEFFTKFIEHGGRHFEPFKKTEGG